MLLDLKFLTILVLEMIKVCLKLEIVILKVITLKNGVVVANVPSGVAAVKLSPRECFASLDSVPMAAY